MRTNSAQLSVHELIREHYSSKRSRRAACRVVEAPSWELPAKSRGARGARAHHENCGGRNGDAMRDQQNGKTNKAIP